MAKYAVIADDEVVVLALAPALIVDGELLKRSGTTIISAAGGAWGGINGTLANQTDLQTVLDAKQATLVSGTNIKTINGGTVLGSGNLAVSASDPSYAPGSFTVATETGRLFISELILNGVEEATLEGTSTGVIL